MLSESKCHQSSHSDKILMLKFIFFVLCIIDGVFQNNVKFASTRESKFQLA